MKAELRTVALIVIAVLVSISGTWWIHSAFTVQPSPVPEASDTVRTHHLEVVDSTGNAKIVATANQEYATFMIRGSSASAPSVHVFADNNRASVVVSAGGKTQRLELSQ